MVKHMAQYHGRNLRLGRVSETSRIYLITTVTRDRTPVFQDLYAARALVRTLMETQHRKQADTLAYVVMPDHLHWLMQLCESDPLQRVVGRVKSLSAHALGGPVWQRGFHDRGIRAEEDLPAVARYVVANPLRGGLVKSIRAYPHWDAIWL
jgi:REP element-mobilizing transposase RayT